MWTAAQKLFLSVVRMASNSELHEFILALLEVPDETWARSAVGSVSVAPTGGLVKIVSSSSRMASEHWSWLLDQRGGETLTPIAEVERHGVRVLEEAPGPLDNHYIHFAAFDPGTQAIHVSTASVKSVTEQLKTDELSQLLGPVFVLDVVLWHEYFHVWSYAMRKTADKHAKPRRRFKPRSRETLLQRTSEELAAVAFSKQASGLAFNPQLLQWLLIYTKDPRRARELARNVLGKSW